MSEINPVPADRPASVIRIPLCPPVALPSKVIVPVPVVAKEFAPALPTTLMPSPLLDATVLPMPYMAMLPPAALMDAVDVSDTPIAPVLPLA